MLLPFRVPEDRRSSHDSVDFETDVLVLGAGMTGLAAASRLGARAIVLERESRPGGLVRTERLGDFWFDHVLHLLHLPDARIEAHVRRLIGDQLAPCPPEAWVETAAGVTRFPFQMHLAGLDRERVISCLTDLAEVTYRPQGEPVTHFEDYLLRTFGRGLCELFLFPYNRKLWKRPLHELAPTGFTWNIARPALDAVLRGALDPEAPYRSYNANGWYPQPPPGADCRGMEVLSRALAREVYDLRCDHTVEAIDLDARIVTVRHDGRGLRIRYRQDCLSTLPLPVTAALCEQTPHELRAACASLTWNRVITVMLGVRGPRPSHTGKWRYYADESICFNRLVYLHEFDPALAPPDAWGLLAEITEPAEWPLADDAAITQRVRHDIARVAPLPPGSRIEVNAVRVIDPAYVVFSTRNHAIAERARGFLAANGLSSLGRYGSWEYSSMAQNMRDGFAWAAARLDAPLDAALDAPLDAELAAASASSAPTGRTRASAGRDR